MVVQHSDNQFIFSSGVSETQLHRRCRMHKDKSGQSLVKTASDMKELTEPLLPDHTSVQDNPKHSVSLSRFVTVGGITLSIFILFIIILASQLPAQQTMGITTVGLKITPTG